jgi:hypothetical protein
MKSNYSLLNKFRWNAVVSGELPWQLLLEERE